MNDRLMRFIENPLGHGFFSDECGGVMGCTGTAPGSIRKMDRPHMLLSIAGQVRDTNASSDSVRHSMDKVLVSM
jgi:hypothetical protein